MRISQLRAMHLVRQTYPDSCAFEDHPWGWTFRVGRRYGYVTSDGTVGARLEAYRSDAEAMLCVAVIGDGAR